MVEREVGRVCWGRLVLVWGVYGVFVGWLWQVMVERGVPAGVVWALAAGMALIVLVWMREG